MFSQRYFYNIEVFVLYNNMGGYPFRFAALTIVATVLLALPRTLNSAATNQTQAVGNNSTSNEDLLRYVDELIKNLSAGPPFMNQNLTKAVEMYALPSIPVLLRNPIFQGVVQVLVDEGGKAVKNANVTIDMLKPILNTDIQQIMSRFNFVDALTRSITVAKPLIEQLQNESDSSLFIMALNAAIKATANGISNPTLQTLWNILTDELGPGFQKSGLQEKIVREGLGFFNNRNDTVVMLRSVLKDSNIPRLTLRLYNATKPILDSLYGGDTEFVYAGLVAVFNTANEVQNNPAYQLIFKFLQDQLVQRNNGTGELNSNTLFTYLRNMNVQTVIGTVLDFLTVRLILPYNSTVEADPISESCYADITDFLDAAKSRKAWALKMLDSYGKIPSGLEKGNINFIGSYDECVETKSDVEANPLLGKARPKYPRSVGSKYCRVRIPVPQNIIDSLGLDTKGIPLKVTWGVCVPDTCYGRDIYGMLKLDVFRNYTSLVESVDCSEDLDVTQDLGAVIAIIILAIFLFLMLVGTLYVSMETRGVFDDNEKSAKADSAYSNIAFTKDENAVKYGTIDIVKAENGQSVKEVNTANTAGLPANYVPHSESSQREFDKAIEEKSNGVSTEDRTKADLQKSSDNTVKQRKKKEGVLVGIAKAFSVQINAPKILTGTTGLNSINCIHGIRFFSLTWVMLGHTFNYGLISSAKESWSTANFVEALNIIQRFTFQAVVAGGFSVDTFYMISGMLLTYIQLKQMTKLKANFSGPKLGNYIMRYFFHRFWRLTPMYGMILLIYATLLKYIGHGPLWPNVVETSENCRESWWTNILYINNLVKVDKQCMAWTWFLANDMQFYVVSLILLFFLTLSLPIGIIVSTLLLMVGIATAIWKEYVYNGNFFTMASDGGDYWNNVYITPWCRVGAYCVGLFLGIIFYKRPRKAFSKTIGFIGWTTATAVALALVYSTYSNNKKDGVTWTNLQNAFYEGVGRPVWSLCVAWVIFACHNDMGGHVNSILSWKGLVPLSRLSYAAYLVHPMMMILHVYSKHALFYLSDYDIIYLFLGHATMSFMCAFVVSIAFEAPFMALEKLILR